MSPNFLIPLAIACISAWVSLSYEMTLMDELPHLVAAVIGTISSMWFFVIIPWPVKLSLIMGILVIGNFLIKEELEIK